MSGFTAERPAVGVPAGAAEGARPRIAWSAVFAGAFVVAAVELLLAVLGVGVGLGMLQPVNAAPAATSLSIGAGLWWLVSTLIAFAFGSYVAARLAGIANRYDGALHGLVIWGVVVLVTFYLLTSAVGGLVGGAFSIIGGTISAAGQGIKAAAPQLTSATGTSPEMIQREAQDFLQQPDQNPAQMSRQDAAKAIAAAIPDLLAGGERATQAKNRIIDIMAAQLHLSREDAAKRLDAAYARFEQTRNAAIQDTKRAADEGAAAASRASYATFGVLLLDAIAACIGGALALPRRPFLFRRTVS